MAYGCFVDIAQQDGSLQRMEYDLSKARFVEWIGINEQMAQKYKHEKESEGK